MGDRPCFHRRFTAWPTRWATLFLGFPRSRNAGSLLIPLRILILFLLTTRKLILILLFFLFPTFSDHKFFCSPGFDIPIAPASSRHISYSPSDPSIYPPPYPVSSRDPVTLISSYPCHIRPDHYRVTFVDGPITINTLVQDDSWDGPLRILRWVAENSLEMVGECEGRDLEGRRIVRFLVFMHFRIRRPEDRIIREGHWEEFQYPSAVDSRLFLVEARSVEELPIPGPFFACIHHPLLESGHTPISSSWSLRLLSRFVRSCSFLWMTSFHP